MKNAVYATKSPYPNEYPKSEHFIEVYHACPECAKTDRHIQSYRQKFDVEGNSLSWDVKTTTWYPKEEKWLCLWCGHKWEDDLKWVVDKLK